MAQKLKKFVALIEMKDGTEYGPYRVGMATKIQQAKTARAKGWDEERDAPIITAFMAWHAARLENVTFETFLAELEDAQVVEMEDEKDGEGGSDDPTQPAL